VKKLPIGIQTIEEIINEGYTYVDKTSLIFSLITEGKYYFLSRPRRFGKSLLISTLKAIFSGKKELFKDCHIYSTDYRWHEHPIIHLDFTQILTKTPQELKDSLQRALEEIAKSYRKSIEFPSLQEGFGALIKQLSEGGKVVILVDEYDKPIIDNLHQIEVAEANRDVLKDVFGILKGLDSYLKFVFITGVSKFSQVSLFSGFNNLKDITIHPNYATLLGYTEEEIRQLFDDRIQKISQESNENGMTTNEQIIEGMREWYNGYRFSWGRPAVYNPHSTLNFLDTGRLEGFWFQTGTPTFLIEQIKKLPQSVISLSGSMAEKDELLDICNPRLISLKALMWQTGYLTIQKYNARTGLYQLDFPNKEVRNAFFGSLLKEFSGPESFNASFFASACRKDLDKHHFISFFQTINMFFANIPYSLFSKENEGFYHAIFISLLESMGIKVHAEQKTNIGRIDLVVELENIIYIFEFKLDKGAKIALEQIEEKKYKEKYSKKGKEIALVGANFSSKTCNISEWKAIIYSSEGKIKENLQSSE